MTPAQAKRKEFAKTLIGKKHDEATAAIAEARMSYQFAVMEGMPCGQNSYQSQTVLCLFSNKDDVIEEVVIGNKGIYNHPLYVKSKNPE